MYRTTDPRFRRRLNEIGQTLESANETAQSGLYIFGQEYVRPCFGSIGSCLSGCVESSCPGGRKRQRGRAERSFDFYDDWEVEEEAAEGLLGWGGDEGYGTVSEVQPGRQRGMSYRKREEEDPPAGFWSRLFGGKHTSSTTDPGTLRLAGEITEGDAPLDSATRKPHRRGRSGTETTSSSYSSRGDLFPSDEEDDAVPLDDEFAMVLERRTTQSAVETESSSNKTRGKRPSAGSRTSTRRTFSERSSRKGRSRTVSEAGRSEVLAVKDEAFAKEARIEEQPPSLSELKIQERVLEIEEEEAVERKRQEAYQAAAERGLVIPRSLQRSSKEEILLQSSKDERLQGANAAAEEPGQLPTSLHTDDEEHSGQGTDFKGSD